MFWSKKEKAEKTADEMMAELGFAKIREAEDYVEYECKKAESKNVVVIEYFKTCYGMEAWHDSFLNGRIYPRMIFTSELEALQKKVQEKGWQK